MEESTILENESETTEQVEKTNEPQEQASEVEQTSEVAEETPQEKPVESQPQSAEPTIEIDGQAVPVSRAKEALEKYANDEKWTAKNTQRAQELAEKERTLQRKLMYADLVEQRPDLIPQLLAPKQTRDIDAELRNHWASRPDPYSAEYPQWEYTKDMLLYEKAKTDGAKESEARFSTLTATTRNETLEKSAWAKLQGKVSWDEFVQMAGYIKQTIRPDQHGAYPENSFDVAYRTLFWDKAIEESKLEATKRASDSIAKAKPASSLTGASKPHEQKTQTDEEDEAFAREIQERTTRGRKAS